MRLFPPAAIVGERRHCWVTALETYGIWRVKKRKPIFHQFATALQLLQKGTEISRRVAGLPGSNAVPASRCTFNVAADQSCVHEDDSASRDIFSIHLHAYIHTPNSGNLDLILSKCLRIPRGLNVRSFNFTSWLNLTKQCWAVILLKGRVG